VAGSTARSERSGIDWETGKPLSGFDHCMQSMWILFTTRIGTRVMRLDVGSDVTALLDSPANRETIARFYAAITEALLKWEPGFRVTRFTVEEASGDGGFAFGITGIYYPRGHLGDYSIAEDRTASFVLSRRVGELVLVRGTA
jgi:phage baseplate assembly protein W